MLNVPAAVGSAPRTSTHGAPPITGVVIGIALSLLLWAMILALVFAVR